MQHPLLTTVPTITAQQFVDKWRNVQFGEKQASQEMFLDLCKLVGHPSPVDYGNSDVFTFEKWVPGGFADAYLEERFGWEFKGSDDQLTGAFDQLLRYQVYLKTPPLLIVSSFRTILIRTNFPGMETVLHEIPVPSLTRVEQLEKLRNTFFNPDLFRPLRTVEDVTRETATLFSDIVADMEGHDVDPEKLARYLNQIIFCLYAEDAGLLPDGLFTNIVKQQFRNPGRFDQVVSNLFHQMAGGGFFGADDIAHFNGDLFHDAGAIQLSTNALQRLVEATDRNWSNIEPSVFGTLFERAIDASKRAQAGAHYTSAADIMLVIEPVIMDPLLGEWEKAREEAGRLLDDDNRDGALARLAAFQERLASVKVLDPASGSGNFLYLSLRSLLDLEKRVIDFAAGQGWYDLVPTVKPDQMLGLEINPYAAELASTALWIGYIQWHQANGFPYANVPILTPLDTIRQTDAILDLSDPDNPSEPKWPPAEFIVGNPPFLGGKLLRTNLSDEYVDVLLDWYAGRVPGEADLVCYWFDKARIMLESGLARRAGLLATQGIRGSANRRVLRRIKETGDIFMAWSDHPWILDGAAVHISMVGFDGGFEPTRQLNGSPVESINANLSTGADLTLAARLTENAGIAFMGDTKGGPFDIPASLATEMIASPNPHNRSNAEVIKPWVNGRDITDRPRGMWIIDFADMPAEQAALYEAPFEYVNQYVRPRREVSRSKISKWWVHERSRPEMRNALGNIKRYIATPRVSKYRLFVWLPNCVVTDSATIAIASDDDYFFGVLHSRIHELWALAMGTQLESRPRYTPTTCFETFPFPEPTDAQRDAIAHAAAELNHLRENWLNPVDTYGNPALDANQLRRRTLTNLYNQRPTWLANAHATLDAAVADAYGWPADLPDAAILERLLALNLERAEEEREATTPKGPDSE